MAQVDNMPEQHHDETTITFTPELLVALKIAYKKARETNCNRFIFHGQGLLTDYAGYLIEFLEDKFNG